MSRHLVESITSKNMLEANAVFEAKIAEIMERKMYEMKRMMQAEAFGAYSLAQIKADLASGKKVRASAPKEKGGLGLSPYDQMKMKQKQKERENEKKVPLPDMKKERRITEGVEVQPDPEGRVRGGKEGPAKGTFKRNVAAKAIKAVRKGSRVAGDVGGEIAGRVSAAKQTWKQYKQQKAKAAAAGDSENQPKSAPEVKPVLPKLKKKADAKPSHIRKNLDNWIVSGDRARSGGRVVDTAGKVVSRLKKGLSDVASELSDIGTSNLK